MSQEKVNRYKEEKRNRKNGTKKKKAMAGKLCAGVIGLALVAWLGYSAVVTYNNNVVNGAVVADISAIDEYVTELNAE